MHQTARCKELRERPKPTHTQRSRHASATVRASSAAMSQPPKASGPLLLVVAAACIVKHKDGSPSKVLLAQRPEGKSNAGLWEFPGGKVDEGETPEGALIRELDEELGLQINQSDMEPLTFASVPLRTCHLLMPLYAIYSWDGTPRGAEGQKIVMVTEDEIPNYAFTPADIPLVPHVVRAMRT